MWRTQTANLELMMPELLTPPTVVVGIDGSRAAIRAALWAVDEAVSRDIPLRLLYVLDPKEWEETKHVDPDTAAHKLATAEIAVRYAFTAVEATSKPVKIEVEIAHGRPIDTLVRTSGSAAMVCVGAVGFNHFKPGRVGSTARALAAAVHGPVAIVREHEGPTRPHPGWIIVRVDQSPDNGVVLETAVEEARLRKAPLRLLSCWRSRLSDTGDGRPVADGDHRVRSELDRRLARLTRRYPDVDIRSVAVRDSILGYLAKNAESVQLVIIGGRGRHVIRQLLGPAGNAALRHTSCSVLIVDRQHL
jgi:nucleotide-binding universal stress UspA family protein